MKRMKKQFSIQIIIYNINNYLINTGQKLVCHPFIILAQVYAIYYKY